MFNIGDSTADFTHALRWNVDTAAGDPALWQNTSIWGTLILGAAPVVEKTSAPETAAPAATDAAATDSVKPATQTGDAIISVAVMVASAAAGTIYIGKKRKHTYLICKKHIL